MEPFRMDREEGKEFKEKITLLKNEYAEGFRARSREIAEAAGETTGKREGCQNPERMGGCAGGIFRNVDGRLCKCERGNVLPLSRSLCPLQKTEWSYTVSRAGIPLRYQDITAQPENPEWYPEHFCVSMRKVEGYIDYLEEHLRKGQGLVLNGNHKAMRTSMAVNILMEALAKGKSGYFIASGSLVDKLFSLPGRTTSKKDREERIDFESRLKQTDLLVWDDLGLEHSEDWVETKALSIISERYNNAKTTIFTTDLDLDEVPRNSIAYHVMEVTREVNEVIGFEKNAPQPEQVDHGENAGHLPGDMDSNGITGSIDPRGVDCDHEWARVVGLGESSLWSYCKKCNVRRHVPPEEQEKEEACEHNWLSWHLSQYCDKCYKTRPFPQPFELKIKDYFEQKRKTYCEQREALRDKGLAEKLAFTDGVGRCRLVSPVKSYRIEGSRLITPRAEPKHHWGKVVPGQDQMCTWCDKTRPAREEKLEVWKKEDIEADQARLKKVIEQPAPKVHPQVEAEPTPTVESTDGSAAKSEHPGYQCEKEEPPRGEKVRPKHDWFESPDENKEICTQCGKTRATLGTAWWKTDQQMKWGARLDLCAVVGLPKVEGWGEEDDED